MTATPVRKRRMSLVLPVEYLKALLHLTGWTPEQAASFVDVTPRQWYRWASGEMRMSGPTWRILLIRAGLPETWRPSPALCWQLARAPKPGVEPIVAWRAAQAARRAASPVVVLRKRPPAGP